MVTIPHHGIPRSIRLPWFTIPSPQYFLTQLMPTTHTPPIVYLSLAISNWVCKTFLIEYVTEYFNFNSAKLFDFYRKVKRAPPIGSSPVIAASYDEQEGGRLPASLEPPSPTNHPTNRLSQ